MGMFEKRLQAVERVFNVNQAPQPTLFLHICDASVPDPDNPTEDLPLNDGSTIAVMPSGDIRGPRVMRLPGESVEALKKRATELMPDVRVFFMVYRGVNDGPAAPSREPTAGTSS